MATPLTGVYRALNPRPEDAWSRPGPFEIDDDIEGEDGSLELSTVSKDQSDKPGRSLKDVIQEASKGVSESTDASYKRLMANCEAFAIKQGFIKKGASFFSASPHQETPMWIAAWILDACDTLNLDGSLKSSGQQRASYTHAQKMRAAMTYAFGRLHGLGPTPWHSSEDGAGTEGNPSVSTQVSSYMLSLRRRKVQNGEIAVSARAVTSDLLKKVYDFNHQTHSPADLDNWGGPRNRSLLFSAFTLAFICFLRVDEVLKIQFHEIEILGEDKLVVSLPFRKTDQFGDIKPFHLKALRPEYQHVCPVRAFAEWVMVLKEFNIKEGYVFRRMDTQDRPLSNNQPMTSEQFLERFRNTLLDVKIDPYPYGTHSFRRGGCQFLAQELRWPLKRLCEWGGWSTEFTHLTIVKYLISWNDEPSEDREEFFNMDRPPALKCWVCGRSCHCA